MDIKELEIQFKKLPLIEKQKIFAELKKEYYKQPTEENTKLFNIYKLILNDAVEYETQLKDFKTAFDNLTLKEKNILKDDLRKNFIEEDFNQFTFDKLKYAESTVKNTKKSNDNNNTSNTYNTSSSLIISIIIIFIILVFLGNSCSSSESDKFKAQMNKSPSSWTDEEINRFNGFSNWLEKQ